jgi:hypothetical protein
VGVQVDATHVERLVLLQNRARALDELCVSCAARGELSKRVEERVGAGARTHRA